MKRLTLAGCALAAAALAVPPLLAQEVGYPPAQSPFRDLPYKQSISLVAGYYAGSRGSAGVAPGPGPALGLHYEIRVGGPAYFSARITQVFGDRVVKDPLQPTVEQQTRGSRSWPITIGDVGLSVNLTGQKSFHGIVPTLAGGIGLASDWGKGIDVGGYTFGTPFAFNFGGSVRWIPSGRVEFRAELIDYFYQLNYPESYRTPIAPSIPAILDPNAALSEWSHNPMLTVGVSYLFAR